MDDRDDRPNAGPSPAIVLVEPQMGENIGMVARAMANFGLGDLRLVAPRDGWPNDKAVATAGRATHVVEAARVYDTLQEAIADLSFVYATTARERDGFKPVRGPVEAGATLAAKQGLGQRTGILFGRERFGLENEEIARADEIVTFPVDPDYASLNIAQAVLLMAYECRKANSQAERLPFNGPQVVPADKQELFGLLEQLEGALDVRGYFRTAARKDRMVDKLRAVLTRPAFTSGEIKVLRGVVASLDYFTPKNPRGAGYPERKAEADQAAGSTRSASDA